MARDKSDDAAAPIKDGLRIHLREIRKRAGLTQEEIAEALLNEPSVGSIRRPTPDIATEHGGGALDPNLGQLAPGAGRCRHAFGCDAYTAMVAERLTRAGMTSAIAMEGRSNRFHAEERLPAAERAELADYQRSGFDRGHMVPSGDMPTRAADLESFSLANIVPQARRLNQGSWSKLEGMVRDMALDAGEVHVVSGPTFEGQTVASSKGRLGTDVDLEGRLRAGPGRRSLRRDQCPAHGGAILIVRLVKLADRLVPNLEEPRVRPVHLIELTSARAGASG